MGCPGPRKRCLFLAPIADLWGAHVNLQKYKAGSLVLCSRNLKTHYGIFEAVCKVDKYVSPLVKGHQEFKGGQQSISQVWVGRGDCPHTPPPAGNNSLSSSWIDSSFELVVHPHLTTSKPQDDSHPEFSVTSFLLLTYF
jgi:hypothetical protein